MAEIAEQYGLTEADISKVIAVFRQYPKISEVILYGSRAMNSFRAGSDIDFTLRASGMTQSELAQLALELDDLLLPYMIDLSLLEDITDPELLGHITRVGKTFYKR